MTMKQKTSEVRMTIEGHICVISLDNVSKKNAITPALMFQLSTYLTTFEDDDNLWVAIMDPAGEHTTAGLDMPKFFGPTATAKPIPKDQVDPFALHRRATKAGSELSARKEGHHEEQDSARDGRLVRHRRSHGGAARKGGLQGLWTLGFERTCGSTR
jgi:enoyl-CoA hydratase/carnithine racemase